MKKAVITILGIQGAKYNDDGDALVKDYNNKASYYFENETKKNYYNTLPLLIDKYSDEYDIVPIYTKEAKIFNIDMLAYENYKCNFNDDLGLIIDDKKYISIFSLIEDTINKYDKVIIDLTHGFRHLPILTILDIVIQNFKSSKKIIKILFAKEIVKHTPNQKGEYEVVNLKSYLDIANISYVLSSFVNNYTISTHIKTDDKDFQILIDMLSKFSEHIMANSLVNLLQKNNSLIEKINNAIDIAIKHDKSKPLKNYLTDIQKHLNEFLVLKEEKQHIQLFTLAKIMRKKGYFLNAITLLNEAVGWYCADSLCEYSSDYKNKFINAINNKYDTYKVISNAKNIIKFSFNDKDYSNELNIKDIKGLLKQISNINNGAKFSKELIVQVDNYRNNLAHANSGKELNEIDKLLEKLFGKFQSYCIQNNILKKKPATVDNLINALNTK